jgi:hypothetical protein
MIVKPGNLKAPVKQRTGQSFIADPTKIRFSTQMARSGGVENNFSESDTHQLTAAKMTSFGSEDCGIIAPVIEPLINVRLNGRKF